MSRTSTRTVRTLATAAAAASALAMVVAPSAHASPAGGAAAQKATVTPKASATASTMSIADAMRRFGSPQLGRNVLVFQPSTPVADIKAAFDAVAAQQLTNQFGPQRYALLFAPGTYGSASEPLVVQVGYYTQVAGLGARPGDVVVNGHVDVYNQCDDTSGCIALNNFWRSVSNLTINAVGGDGCRTNTEFWAVSQAAPMRRVQVNGKTTLMDYCTAGPQYASGGFIADSVLSGADTVSGSQQQFLVRNSRITGWSNGVWNQVFSGVDGAPAQSFGEQGANPYTTLATSGTTRETPWLALDAHGALVVHLPSGAHGTSGPSWDAATRTIPLTKFLVAQPSTPLREVNRALAQGRNLLLTPGVYRYDKPIRVTRPDTVVMGLGLATITPTAGNEAIDLVRAPGSVVTGLLLDAGPRRSQALLRVGASSGRHAQPTLVSDTFFRIGGAGTGKVDTALVVDGSNVVLDDIWAWRADHGTGVGWTKNTADTGLVVRGSDVSAYGLFVEHFQKTEVRWLGPRGSVVFFQNEMPYDVPNQKAWMLNRRTLGFPAMSIESGARGFRGWGMGSYSNFTAQQDVHASEAFSVAARNVTLRDTLTVFLNGDGGIDSVVNGSGPAVDADFHGPGQVVTYRR